MEKSSTVLIYTSDEENVLSEEALSIEGVTQKAAYKKEGNAIKGFVTTVWFVLSSTLVIIAVVSSVFGSRNHGYNEIGKATGFGLIPNNYKDGTPSVDHISISKRDEVDEWAGNEDSGLSSIVEVNNVLQSQRFLQGSVETCTEECCNSQFACPLCPSVQGDGGSSTSWIDAIPSLVQYAIILLLLSLSALFSGLTLGLLALDITGLEIIIASDDKQRAEYAKKILPVRKNGNQLLCTLVLGNVAVNSLTAILTADKFGGTVGFILSTFLIVICGEIVPQAVCNRNGLWVGSRTIPIIRFFLVLLFPVAKPMAMLLDYFLGRELVTIYNDAEMLKLFQIHVKENAIDHERATIMTGALKYNNRLVKDAMTPIDKTFMLNVDDKLNFQTIAKVFKSGYSRIPVYEISRNHVVGLLLVKDLIFIDPEDNTRVADVVEIFGRQLHVVWQDDPLSTVLRELKKGRSHMALVRDVAINEKYPMNDPYYELQGIITLEDIIEEILGDEIVDETDLYLDGSHSSTVDRSNFDWGRLRLLDSKIVDERLSLDEAKAVVAHLQKNHSSVVSLISNEQLLRLVMEESFVVQLHPSTVSSDGSDASKELLYTKGVETDFCTLILSGKVTVIVGEENFHTHVSSWCLLAPGAVEKATYKPDFTAYVSGDGDCRCLRIMRSKVAKAVDASAAYKHLAESQPDVEDTSSSDSFDAVDDGSIYVTPLKLDS